MSEQTISIIGQIYPQAQRKAISNSYRVSCKETQNNGLSNIFRVGCKEVSLDIVRENLAAFINNLSTTFDQVTATINNYELDEIEVKVDITVSGGVRLIGSMETGMDGGVTLKFKRKSKNE